MGLIFLRNTLVAFTTVLLFINCSEPMSTQKPTAPCGPFFGLQPTDSPQILLPDFIASPLEEFNGTFNPEGTEFYYTTVIQQNFPQGIITVTRMQDNGCWSEPEIASFSGEADDYDPIFSPDGSSLYFSSRRFVHDSLAKFKSNIWYMEKEGESWGKLIPLPLTAQSDYYSSLTRDGKIYFNVWATGNLFKASPSENGYEVQELDTIINRSYDQGDPFVSPDEDYLIFRGYGEDSKGRGDLYISFNIDGQWTLPENLGAPINSMAHEMCPYVTADGKLFVFASGRLTDPYKPNPSEPISILQQKSATSDNGELNLFYMSADFIQKLKEKYLKNP